jgi:uncharacterized iron-regulated membrane protein
MAFKAGWILLVVGAGLMMWLLRVLRRPGKRRPAVFKDETRILIVIVAVLGVIMAGLVLIYTGFEAVPGSL